ncbi:unnamed protein product [Symbiodinium sp. CCMP2592]|nr:unnamed protein product [Symbiodinium sp. CCMP2592]
MKEKSSQPRLAPAKIPHPFIVDSRNAGIASADMDLLLNKPPTKNTNLFGWWPLWQEVVPLEDGRPDKALVVANVGAGLMIGIRQGLSAMMTSSLIFTTADVPELNGMFAFGISMMWLSSAISAAWYGAFGRMQAGLIGINDVIGILWGTMGGQVAVALASEPERIVPTQLAIIAVSTILTGIASIVFGHLGLGKLMLLFPAPVTSGFLGSIGFFIFKSSLQISSGVKFRYLWPQDFEQFLQVQPLARVACMFGALVFMRKVPPRLVKLFPKSAPVKKLGGLACQLVPLFLFYLVVQIAGVDMMDLSEAGWTYPRQGSSRPSEFWREGSWAGANWNFVWASLPSMGLIVMMSVLCTMTGALGIAGKFPTGPPGDPAPTDALDYDRELLTVGWVDLLLGMCGGIIAFHRLGSSVQLRMDGGSHRVSVFTCALFCGGLFLSGVPIGYLIPTWFLGALFMNSSISLVEDALLSYRHLPTSKVTLAGVRLPSPEYGITLACIAVAVVWSPFAGIGTGLALSIFEFLWQSSQGTPVSGVSSGHLSMGRTKRPVWELRVLRKEGDRIVLLFLQGRLFFGSAEQVSQVLNTATDDAAGRLKYCVLSFSRVIDIDASAAKQVKTSVEKAFRSGVHVFFSRMSPDVFQELSMAGAIKSPDPALRQVLQDRGVDIATEELKMFEDFDTDLDAESCQGTSGRLHRRMTCNFRPLGAGAFDAFDTESDALDYCNDLLLGEYCYNAHVEEYKSAYRRACQQGERLPEQAFEDMNFVPRGTLARLRPLCQVRNGLPHYTSLTHDQEPTLYLIFRGAIAQFEQIGEDITVARSGKLHAEVKGFTGRGNKRLRARYPPGHIVGKTSFFLHGEEGLVDHKMLPMLQVSSRMSGYAEVWELTRSSWDKMPEDLKSIMEGLMLFQLADDRQHSLLIE